MEIHHTPVMVEEVLASLQTNPRGLYVDCTIGEGGHSLAILEAMPESRLLGIDLDAQALKIVRQRLRKHIDNVTLVHGNFAHLNTITRENRAVPANGIVFDLGLSSLQVDNGSRGFSFRKEARLDMRFDQTQEITAHQIVNEYGEQSLADIIYRFGEEPKSRRLARAIVRSRPIETTIQLANVVGQAMGKPPRGHIHPATRTFQAIRMAVNRELDNLGKSLEQAIRTLTTGGRMIVISYHSLEDRLVKGIVRRESSGCICPPEELQCVCNHTATICEINRRVIKPSESEVRANPRSRSARMRVAERLT